MNQGRRWLFLGILAASVTLLPGSCWAQSQDDLQAAQQQKKAVEQQKQDPEQEYTEEEYDAYDKAVKEPDLGKRPAALIAFMEKYPKSKLQPHIVFAYESLLFEYQKAGDSQKLLPLAEQWLKFFPNDLKLFAYITEAAQKLGQDAKVIEYGQKVYAQRPSAQVAFLIYQTYQKMKDTPKQQEWGLKLLEYPEFNDNFEIRMQYVIKYVNEKNLPKAAEYAYLTLKSLDLAKKPEAASNGDWNKAVTFVRRTSHDVIGMNLYERGKYNEAIEALRKALAVEMYDTAWYYIALAQWKLQEIEDAIQSFAIAELLKGEFQAKAKENCELLYKETHNGNLTAIDKVYRKAQAAIDAGVKIDLIVRK